jgi:hypothetical protein
LSVAAAELRNFFWKIADCFRVWTLGGFKYAERRRQRATRGASPPPGAARRGARHPLVWWPSGPSPALFRSSSFVREK